MLQEIMEDLNNYFVPISAKLTTYTIADGAISPSFDAQDGDRFLICGSRRNDGVYTWHPDGIRDDDDIEAAGLREETFAGTIRVCSVPPALLALSGEIKGWADSNSAQLNGLIAGESFNGYSYTLKTGKTGGTMTWRDLPAAKKLERWRKPNIC